MWGLLTQPARLLSAVFLAGILVTMVGCARPLLAREEVRYAIITAQSSDPEANAKWQATDAELDALVEAINSSDPFRQEGGTTPRVLVVMTLRDGSTIRLMPTSQGVHYLERDGETRPIQGKLLDEQFDYLEAKAGRIGEPVK